MNNKCSEKNDKLYYIMVDGGDAIYNSNEDVIYYTSFENAWGAIEEFAEAKNLCIYKRGETTIKAIDPDDDATIRFDIEECDSSNIINAHYEDWINVDM